MLCLLLACRWQYRGRFSLHEFQSRLLNWPMTLKMLLQFIINSVREKKCVCTRVCRCVHVCMSAVDHLDHSHHLAPVREPQKCFHTFSHLQIRLQGEAASCKEFNPFLCMWMCFMGCPKSFACYNLHRLSRHLSLAALN